jgi:hypothetical protein
MRGSGARGVDGKGVGSTADIFNPGERESCAVATGGGRGLARACHTAEGEGRREGGGAGAAARPTGGTRVRRGPVGSGRGVREKERER